MKNIVFYSFGICSAYIACRLQDECQSPVCIFSDTKREDEDTYRFGHEVAERWKLNLVDASRGGDLWDSWRKHNMIPARQLAQCSLEFKIQPSRAYLNEHFENPGVEARVAYGYDVSEQKRADRTTTNWDYKHISVWFPLIEWQVTKAECFGYFSKHGIKAPRIYQHFQHANCLPCKNFRENDWKALAYYYPIKFAEAATFEIQTGLRFMQDGPRLVELDISDYDVSRKRRKKLVGAEPAFSFDMGCDRCAID